MDVLDDTSLDRRLSNAYVGFEIASRAGEIKTKEGSRSEVEHRIKVQGDRSSMLFT